MRLKEILLPQDKGFFDLLENISKSAVIGASELYELFSNYSKVGEMRKKLKEVEHTGDELVHQTYTKLGGTFITPIDRNDISRLASALDSIIDLIYAVALRMDLYRVDRPSKYMIEMCEVVVTTVGQLHDAVRQLKEVTKKSRDILDRCTEIHRLENVADDQLNNAVAEVFQCGDAIQIIKFKEIYEKLEEISDRCEDAADVIRDILIEYT